MACVDTVVQEYCETRIPRPLVPGRGPVRRPCLVQCSLGRAQEGIDWTFAVGDEYLSDPLRTEFPGVVTNFSGEVFLKVRLG